MYALRERRVHVTQEDFEMAVAKVCITLLLNSLTNISKPPLPSNCLLKLRSVLVTR